MEEERERRLESLFEADLEARTLACDAQCIPRSRSRVGDRTWLCAGFVASTRACYAVQCLMASCLLLLLQSSVTCIAHKGSPFQ